MLLADFDEYVDEEAESQGDVEAFAALTVGSRDWTVDTIVDQIRKNNIDLDPAFQRRSAWNDEKRSRFVESLILGVPIPQIVLAEEPLQRGKFLVIDGKQRLLSLAGLSIDRYNFWARPRFVGLNTFEGLNGKTLTDFLTNPDFANERRLLANAPIRCAVLSGTSNKNVFYDIFYRLNSGAVPLSGQELRQVFYKGHFAQYLFQITNEPAPIHKALGLDQPDPRLFDIELILRYMAIRLNVISYRGDLRAYLDAAMEYFTEQWSTARHRADELYADLNRTLGTLDSYIGLDNIGRRFTGTRTERRFNKAVFEVEVYYFRFVTPEALVAVPNEAFRNAFAKLCAIPEFRSSIEATTKSIGRFETRFGMFRNMLNELYDLRIDESPTTAG